MFDRSIHESRLFKRILLFLIILVGISFRFYNLTYPLILTQDTGYIPTFAKNLSETDFKTNKLIPVRNYYKDSGKVDFHQAHPSLTHNLLSIMFKFFGVKESVYRVFNILTGGLLGAISLFLLIKMFLGYERALGALFFWAIIPSSAYFERMFSMTMQAYSMILLFLYLFFRYYGNKTAVNRNLLLASSIIGPLWDWHFLFIFPFLFLYAFIKRKYLWMTILNGLIAGSVLGTYLIYSNVSVYNRKAASITNLSEGWWWSYIKVKFGFFDIFTFDYFRRVYKLFLVHYTNVTLVVLLLWLSIFLYRYFIRKDKDKNVLLLLYLLFMPGLFYIVMVPHNTIGHIWTLYCLWSPIALIFGCLTGYIIKAPKFLRYSGLLILCLALIYSSTGKLMNLHKISLYHLLSTRLGDLCSIYAEDSSRVLAWNYDTLSFYADMPVIDTSAGKNLMKELGKTVDKPIFIAKNRGPYTKLNVIKNGDLAKIEKENEVLSSLGFKLWIKSPAYVWTNIDTTDLYLFMEQYTVAFEEVKEDKALNIQSFFGIDGGRLLRGFYQAPGVEGSNITRFKDIEIGSRNHLGFSIYRGKGIVRSHCKVYIMHEKDKVMVFEGSVGEAEDLLNSSIDVSRYKGCKVDFIFTSEGDGSKEGRLYWFEPELSSKGFSRNIFLKGDSDIYIGTRRFIKVD